MRAIASNPTLLYFIATTLATVRRKRLTTPPVFGEIYRQRFFGDPMHVCYGCSHTNEDGLQLDFHRTDQGGLGFSWNPTAGLESFPNILHGGISGTLLDELGAVTIQAELNRFAFTVSSRITFHAPTYRDRLVLGHAKVLTRHKQHVLVSAILHDKKGKILASMTALYFIPNRATFKKVTKIAEEDISDTVASYVD